MRRGVRLVGCVVLVVGCGGPNDTSDAGDDASIDGTTIDATKDATPVDAPSDVTAEDAGDALDANDDVTPVPCSLTVSGAVSATLDCVAHGAPYTPQTLEQLSIHATATSSAPFDVLVLCNEYKPIQLTTYTKPWSPVNDDGCYGTVTEQLPDGGQGRKWNVGQLGSDGGSVSFTITYMHQQQGIYLTIDGHAESEAPELTDSGAGVVDIQATF